MHAGNTINELCAMVERVVIQTDLCQNEIRMGSDSRDRGLCNRKAVVTDMVDERQKCMKCFEASF